VESVINEHFPSCMPISLMQIIQSYVDATNTHDVKSIVACFADDAVLRDENATRHGKIEIERWATETIDNYKFHSDHSTPNTAPTKLY